MALTVDTDIPDGIGLLGKDIDELQENVSAGINDIAGTLHYVTEYTGFSGDTAEQEGNYVALHIDTDVEGAVITVKTEYAGEPSRTVTLDSDRTIIIRVRHRGLKITVTATADGYETVTRTYNTVGLVLEEAS